LAALVLSPCTLNDKYYVIQTSTYNLDTDFNAFTYTTDPVVTLPSSYSFSYAITAVLTTGGALADPSWADLSTTVTRRFTIATTNSADAGTYDFVLKGTLNDSLNTFAQVAIKVYLIEIVTSTPADMTFPVGHTANVS
jgi:hypothetical protein